MVPALYLERTLKTRTLLFSALRFFFVMGERGGVVVGNHRRMYMRCRRRSGFGGGKEMGHNKDATGGVSGGGEFLDTCREENDGFGFGGWEVVEKAAQYLHGGEKPEK